MTQNTYNILSLDGGGLRGLITAVLLDRLEYTRPGFLGSLDLIVGTSTGGILALALAKGLPPYAIMKMYMNNGGVIFNRSVWRKMGGALGLTRAKYDNDGLRSVLTDVFGNGKLAELTKKVAVTAFRLDNGSKDQRTWSPKVFHNFPGTDSDGDERALDVALYTSAAPTYFPSVGGYVDGGVFANNPSLVGLAQALDARHPGGPIDKIRLLSVGTGENLSHLEGDRLDWGIAEWAAPLLNILFDGVSEVADFQCRQILRDNYHRLQLSFPPGTSIPMDSVDDLGNMLCKAQAVPIVDTVRWLADCGWCGDTTKTA